MEMAWPSGTIVNWSSHFLAANGANKAYREYKGIVANIGYP